MPKRKELEQKRIEKKIKNNSRLEIEDQIIADEEKQKESTQDRNIAMNHIDSDFIGLEASTSTLPH